MCSFFFCGLYVSRLGRRHDSPSVPAGPIIHRSLCLIYLCLVSVIYPWSTSVCIYRTILSQYVHIASIFTSLSLSLSLDTGLSVTSSTTASLSSASAGAESAETRMYEYVPFALGGVCLALMLLSMLYTYRCVESIRQTSTEAEQVCFASP